MPSRHSAAFNGSLVFAITIVAAYASALPGALRDGLGGGDLVLLVALGLAYIFIGSYGDHWWHRFGGPGPRLIYFAIQLVLAGAILYLCRVNGFMSLIIFPLISQAQASLSRWLALLVGALCVLTFGAVLYAVAGLGPTLTSLPVIIAGFIFVAVFTDVALREQVARGEVARLAAELRAANQKLREAAGQVEELATIQERNRLARDIHDSLGHYLTVINVQLEASAPADQSLLVEDGMTRDIEHDDTRSISMTAAVVAALLR
ncbi:MAG: histidine kinase dimerization/phosphoacceptor domain-containing protein [Anaerolineales bacterium]